MGLTLGVSASLINVVTCSLLAFLLVKIRKWVLLFNRNAGKVDLETQKVTLNTRFGISLAHIIAILLETIL